MERKRYVGADKTVGGPPERTERRKTQLQSVWRHCCSSWTEGNYENAPAGAAQNWQPHAEIQVSSHTVKCILQKSTCVANSLCVVVCANNPREFLLGLAAGVIVSVVWCYRAHYISLDIMRCRLCVHILPLHSVISACYTCNFIYLEWCNCGYISCRLSGFIQKKIRTFGSPRTLKYSTDYLRKRPILFLRVPSISKHMKGIYEISYMVEQNCVRELLVFLYSGNV